MLISGNLLYTAYYAKLSHIKSCTVELKLKKDIKTRNWKWERSPSIHRTHNAEHVWMFEGGGGLLLVPPPTPDLISPWVLKALQHSSVFITADLPVCLSGICWWGAPPSCFAGKGNEVKAAVRSLLLAFTPALTPAKPRDETHLNTCFLCDIEEQSLLDGCDCDLKLLLLIHPLSAPLVATNSDT